MPLAQLLWQDTLLYGTAVNVAAALCGLLLLANDAPAALGAIVYFAPLPYNLFLVAAIWKSSAALAEPWTTTTRLVGLAWLLVVMVI